MARTDGYRPTPHDADYIVRDDSGTNAAPLLARDRRGRPKSSTPFSQTSSGPSALGQPTPYDQAESKPFRQASERGSGGTFVQQALRGHLHAGATPESTMMTHPALLATAVNLNPPGRYVHWSIFTVSVANLAPVSYTHLDVYKRQGASTGSWSSGTATMPSFGQ